MGTSVVYVLVGSGGAGDILLFRFPTFTIRCRWNFIIHGNEFKTLTLSRVSWPLLVTLLRVLPLNVKSNCDWQKHNRSTNFVNEKLHTKRENVAPWKHFPNYWPFVNQIRQLPVVFSHKGFLMQRLDVLIFVGWKCCWTQRRIFDDFVNAVTFTCRQRNEFDSLRRHYFAWALFHNNFSPSG